MLNMGDILKCIATLSARIIGCAMWLLLFPFVMPNVAFAAATFGAQISASNAPPGMTIPGQFTVGSTGGASYSIPITVPPGTAGMVPTLSLDYSSLGTDGPEGIGWAVNGLSSITRCPRTIAQDGVHGSVNYDSNDQFCLDGQRLIYVTTTPTLCGGGSGNVYRTEIESYSRIVSCGTTVGGGGPVYFQIWTKSGQIMEYGGTVDSSVKVVTASGSVLSTVRTWMVDKVSTSVGNYFTVTYNCAAVSGSCTDSSRTTYGEVYPLEVDYTGNAGAGLSPHNAVQFTYVGRSDGTAQYQAGAKTQMTVLLSHIKTYQNGSLVYDYQLGYRAGTNITHSRLTSLTLCDASSPTQKCLAPTTFGWQGGSSQFTLNSVANFGQQNPHKMAIPGDYNNDGITDEAILDSANGCPPYTIYYGPNFPLSPTGSLSAGSWASGATSCGAISTSAGPAPDGSADIAINILGTFPTIPHSRAYFFLLNSGNYSSLFGWTPGPTFVTPYVGDFDGNGIVDYTQQTGSSNQLFLGNSSGVYSAGTTYATTTLMTGDFDGDGCTDLYGLSNAIVGVPEVLYMCNPAVSSTTTVPDTTVYNAAPIMGDFNGDGKTDFLIANNFTNTVDLWLSTGTGFIDVNPSLPSGWTAGQIYAGDWNGDGKADILAIGGSGYEYYISTGTDFTPALDSSGNPIPITSFGYGPIVADWNNDGAADFVIQDTSPSDTLYSLAYAPELMISVNNGVGSVTNITYAPINQNGTFYTNGSGATYPTRNIDGAIYVVKEVDSSNGLGTCIPPSMTNCNSLTYTYGNYQTDVSGRGSLGFQTVASTDSRTNIVETTTYCQLFPLTGFVSTQTRVHVSTTLSSVTNSYNGTSGCGASAPSGVVNLTESVVVSNDLNGSAFPTKTTDYTYDSYGNALTTAVKLNATLYSTTTNTYFNDATNWFLGELTDTKVNNVVGASNLTRHSIFCYDAATALRTKDIIEPGSLQTCTSGSVGTYTLETDYGYDGFGNVTSTTVSGPGIATRTSYAGYDAWGQFQISATNALSQTEQWTYDARFGEQTSHTDLNGLVTSWTYDTFDRLTLEVRPDGTRTSSAYAYCSGVNGGSASCPTYGAFDAGAEVFASDGVTQIGAVSTAYYDMLARSIAKETQGFDGSNIQAATQYDANGRVQESSRPYFTSGGTPQWTTYTYDDLGRVTRATFPDTSHTDYGFSGLTTTVTDNAGHITTTVKNNQGLVASVQDPNSQTTSYVYDAFGDVTTVTDPAGNVVTNGYDIRGNKTSSADPDLGSWTYSYDVLGELTGQTDAKSQASSATYDLLGRASTRTEVGLYSSWTYGTSPGNHNVGLLIDAEACTASGCATLVSDRAIVYDSLARPSVTSQTTPTVGSAYTDTYNATNGLLASVAYPSGLIVNYNYNAFGYLTDLADNTGGPIWRGDTRDAELHLTKSTAGNGVATTQSFDPATGLIQSQRAGPSGAIASLDYQFDSIGNLQYRTDNNNSYTERFCYDNLSRLTNYAIGASCTSAGTTTVGYDSVGNITSKTDLGSPGTYSYPTPGTARPHAVSSISGTVDGLSNPQYTYDGNGNLTCASSGTGCTGTVARVITLTSFNMMASIVQGADTVSLTYDDQHQRIRQLTTATGVSVDTVYMRDPVSGALSQRVANGVSTPAYTFTDYVQVDGQIVAQRTIQFPAPVWGNAVWNSFNWGPAPGTVWNGFNWGGANWTGPVVAWSYFTLDNLGSVVAIADHSGTLLQAQSYDAWGKPRNVNGTAASCGTITSSTTRGFTNQEEMPAPCLVNLNARVYDPSIGKFQAADPVVADPDMPNAFNRYAYANNAPTMNVDSTGYDAAAPKCNTITKSDGITTETACVTGYKEPPNNPAPPPVLLPPAATPPPPRTPQQITPSILVAVGRNGKQPICPSPWASAIYKLGANIGQNGGQTTTYGVGTVIVTAPGYLTPVTVPAAVAGTLTGSLGIAVGDFMSTAGSGLQIGSGMWIGGETGNWRPLAASGIPAVAGLIAPLSPLIGPTLEDRLQNYIESRGPNYQSCLKAGG